MSKMKDEWDDFVQRGREELPSGKTFGNGFESFEDWVKRVKRENYFGDSKNTFALETNCDCGECITNWHPWDEVMPSDFEFNAQETFDELLDILVSKQEDYGPNNIQNAPGGPLNGLQVRLYDKMSRLINLIQNNADPKNESLRDTFIDIANYGAIGVMILDETFPKAKD